MRVKLAVDKRRFFDFFMDVKNSTCPTSENFDTE